MNWRRAGPLAGVAFSLVVLLLLLRELDPAELRRVLTESRWGWVAAAAIINLLNTLIESFRWALPASAVKPGLRVGSAFRALLAGTLGNVVLPMKLGDGVRAYVFAQSEEMPLASAVSTVVLDRMIDLSAFVVVVLLTLLVYPLPDGALHVTRYVVIALAAGLVAVIALVNTNQWRRAAGPSTAFSRAAGQMERFIAGLSALRRGRLLAPACVAALLSWLTRLMVIWAAFKAFSLPLSLVDAAVVLVIVNLGIAVVATPGNVGPFEVAVVGALRLLSVPHEAALGFAVTLHAAEVLPPVLIGLVLVWTGRLHLGREQLRAPALSPGRASFPPDGEHHL
jgi:glycosyltransferase 2 family protein